jgi:predicted phosphoribosyltransferase
MRAAIVALRQMKCDRIIIAVPVAPPEICEAFKSRVDEVVCARTPESFEAVSAWYQNFSQTTDQEVKELLLRAGTLRTVPIFS